jgi:hypothetical protein
MAKESGNGLTAPDRELLEQRLANIREITARPAYFSAFEREALLTVQRKIELRLDPPAPMALAEEADALLKLHGGTLTEAVRSMERGRDPVDESLAETLG